MEGGAILEVLVGTLHPGQSFNGPERLGLTSAGGAVGGAALALAPAPAEELEGPVAAVVVGVET